MRLALVGIALVAAACEGPPVSPDCEGAAPSGLSGTASTGTRLAPVDSALVVEGTTDHADDLAIRSVEVGGVPASATGFNFASWSAEVPWQVLSELAGDDASATVSVIATDACGVQATLSELQVDVAPVPGGEVTRLDLELSLPGDADWLPADGTTPAVVRLVANPEARGTAVDLSASLGALDGAEAARLAGDGTADAELRVLFTSDVAGAVLLAASADDNLVSETLLVVGAPSLTPAVLELLPGESASITARSEGAVETCTASADAGIVLSSGGVDLARGAAASDANGDGHPDILVRVDEEAAAGATAVLTCSDRFGQRGTSAVRVR